MLTLTLRNLERDGLITRAVTPTVPPRVDYALTLLGRAFGDAARHARPVGVRKPSAIEAARRDFDAKLEVERV